MYDGAKSFPLIAIPLFILAGAIMNTSGISRRLIAFASALLGFITRRPRDGQHRHLDVLRRDLGLGGRRRRGDRLDPDPGDAKKRGYPKEFAAAVTSSSASLAIIIPPSIPMILYAMIADTSVVQLFVAGIIPGLIGAAGLMADVLLGSPCATTMPVEEVFRLQPRVGDLQGRAWAFLLPIIILGGIFGGIVTATEGAGLAVVAALFVGVVIYRELDLRHLYRA